MSRQLEIDGTLFRIQAIITGMSTPKGAGIHKSYPIAIDELSRGKLRYTSKFAVPLGTTMCISALRGGQPILMITEVFGNQRTMTGQYSVGCRILYAESDFSLAPWLKSYSISMIN